MFALHKSVRLKRDILEVLENTDEYISTKQLTDILVYPSFNSVKQACAELKQQFEQFYHKEDAEFSIKVSEGVKLIRHSANTHHLIEELVANDLAYTLLFNLLVKRTLVTDLFLENNYITRTTLYNRIRILNDSLHRYGLHIALSSRISFRGAEHHIRMFGYIFLFNCHRMIQFFPDITLANQMNIEQVTTNIFDYLKIPISKNQKQKLAILTYITTESIKTHSHIPENSLFQHTNSIIYPDKPDFLSHWSMSDWQFYVAFLYIYNLIDSQYNDQLILKSEFLFEEAIQTWLISFEKYLFPLFESEKKATKILLDKQLIYTMNFPFEEKLLDNFNELNDYTDYQQFPELIERFDFFWQELTEKQKIYQNSEYIRRMSLLTAIKLVDFEQLTPKLKIYIFSDISDLHKNYLRARLKTTLTTYALTFVENYKEAQLIISTIEFLEELNESQRLLQVCSNFSLIDMSIVERAAQKITSTAIDG
jgi:hypothetical protein